MMKLYKVSVEGAHRYDCLVLANNETQASRYVMKKHEEWGYSTQSYVECVKLIAEADQYGEPLVLLNAISRKESKDVKTEDK